jgi:Family of unknown function (DUF5304)
MSEYDESAAGEREPAGSGFESGENGGAEDDGFEIPVFDSVDPGPAQGPGPAPEADRAQPGGAAGRPGRPDPAGLVTGGHREQPGPGSAAEDTGTLAEEVRKLWDVVQNHFVVPVLRNYPEAAGHLTSAGLEVASAFRALVRDSEQRWTGKPPAERTDEPGTDWDGRIVIGEDGGDIGEDTADRPTE